MTKMNMWKSVKQLENKNGILYFDGANTIELAEKFGTPLYVYSETRIRENYRRLVKAYTKYYKKFRVYYAIKANNNPAVVSVLRSEGCGADCSGVPEIKIARGSNIKESDILYSGVYNSNEELKYAVETNARINLEDISQLERLAKMKVPEFLCFRINPGMGESGEEGLIFAGSDAKFGIIERDVERAYVMAKELGVKRFGIHMMTGSNILKPDYFEQVVEKLLDIAGPISKKLGIEFEFIDIGGSLGVPYKPEQEELDIDEVAKRVVKKFKEKLKEYDMGEPYLIHEPGRYLVCDAGILITKVTSIKNGYKKFIGVDAGMHTLLRPAIYGSYHHIFYANNLKAEENEKVNVVGQICENTDQLAKDRMLSSKIQVGDVLVLLDAGSYGFGMSSQYNTRERPAEVLVNNGKSEIIRERELYDALVRGVHVPERLK
ncbi:MAG TPA: diaminopimelate decarboxylase [archaeon]|nr:diaminopimelate decarboxylase [archaeon]